MCAFDIKKYSSRLKTSSLGRKLVYFKEIDSTNNYASRIIREGSLNDHGQIYNIATGRCRSAEIGFITGSASLDGTVVLAEIQSGGRGQFNRRWISPSGGLWFTMILKPEVECKNLPAFTLLAAYSVADTLKNVYGIKTVIKWPNDIYLANKKIGGILAETEISGISEKNKYLLIGVGVNINFNKDSLGPVRSRATTIKSILNKNLEIEPLFCRILLEFENNYLSLKNTGDFKTIFAEIEKYLIY